MIKFNYLLNQDNFELQASDWCGLEKVMLNGKVVSKKFNFGILSCHDILLNDGHKYQCKLLVDPQTDLLTCRIYNQRRLVTVLRQGKKQLQQSQRLIEASLMTLLLSLLVIYILA
ncbi:hypothetical protein [Shewanella sp. HL-SH2]|uniref:hypothetical protein n=1 Tax=Shewanella sp. HL-SH2 TaxID=3436238 RepID=UPI003EB6AF06